MMLRFPIVLFVTASVLAFVALGPTETASAASAIEVCGDCHEDRVEDMARSPHSALESEGWQLPEGVKVSCSACHGDASTHLEEGGGEGTMFNFEGELSSVITDRCMTCHHDTHPRFAATPHAQSGLSCISCHTIHSKKSSPPLLNKPSGALALEELDKSSTTCINCHTDVFNLFEYNERHRLQEGILQCTTCHDPHAPPTRARLGGFKQEMCLECHTDKGGPFVYEHGSVRVEGCVACHEPHGSPNRHQLHHQSVAELCFSCHAMVPSFHFGSGDTPRFELSAQCTNCHSAIHGSNFDPFFLK